MGGLGPHGGRGLGMSFGHLAGIRGQLRGVFLRRPLPQTRPWGSHLRHLRWERLLVGATQVTGAAGVVKLGALVQARPWATLMTIHGHQLCLVVFQGRARAER